MSYVAVIGRIKVRPHPNADRLLLGNCLGNQVIVGLDTKEGAIGCYFPTDGQLSDRMCQENNLYTVSARARLGLQEAPAGGTGFFDHNRRVRCQRFRQERSDGLWMPLESLTWTGIDLSKLKEGDTFTELGGYEVCRKYYTPATLRVIGSKKAGRREARCFPKHEDTKQFRFVADTIPEGSIIYITEKLHGTSGRVGFVWDETPLRGWRRLLAYYAGKRPVQAGWTYLNGSKNVILEKTVGAGWYGTNDFRYNVVQGLDGKLQKGEVLYFEIVGWVRDGTPIMPPHDVTKTGLSDIKAQYGNQMHYTYGCPNGTCRMYVYKIVNVNVDGVARELPWTQVVARCHELEVNHVPLLVGPYIMEDAARLRSVVETNTEGPSTLDATQIREGVVVRAESSQGISYAKSKQFAFGVMEGYLAENEAFVDPEEVS